VEFFQPPKPRPAPNYDQPDWSRPKPSSLGATVPWRMVLAESERARIVLKGALAHAAGIELTVGIRVTTGKPDHGLFHRMAHPSSALQAEFFRFGVELADGRKLTNLDEREDEPSARLGQMGGGGGGDEYEWRYWLWPLPPAGPLTFVCEWPAFDIPLTRTSVTADEALDAASRARILWS
jgi:hypothetical protein